MNKKLFLILAVSFIGITSIFSSTNLMPLQASSGDGNNQVIGSIFYLGTVSNNVSASSVGVAAFYQNKLNDNIGIYANGGAGKSFAFKFNGSSNYNNTVAVFIQSGPYYIIPIAENMLIKVGGGLDITLLGGKDSVTSDEAIVVAFGAGIFGSFEYALIDNIKLIGGLNIGFDALSWMTNSAGDLERSSGVITNIMPSVGASYSF